MKFYDRKSAPGRADTWFVYVLVDSREPSEIRYVGITNDPRRRLNHHCSPHIEPHTRKSRWIAKVLREGGDIWMCALDEGLSHDYAKSLEIELIDLSYDYSLTNLTKGGDGTSGRTLSASTRDKIREKAIGRAVSPETRLKISVAGTGRASPNKGVTYSADRREKISAGLKNRYMSAEEREKTRLATLKRYENPIERDRTSRINRNLAPTKRNKSGYKGVSHCVRTGRWMAQIKTGKRIHLGRFPTPEEAARAYDRAAFEAWGSDCYLNFPADFEMAA